MKFSQFKPKQYICRTTLVGFCFWLFATPFLSGCADLQSGVQASPEEVPPVAKTVPLPAATSVEKAAPVPMPEEKATADVNDDKTIYFPLRVTAVDEEGKEKLRRHVEYLKQNPTTVVTLVGYVHDLGSRNYNLAITEQRITTIKKLLRAYGVPTGQIRRNSRKVFATCRSADCRQKMHKVELVYLP